MNNGPIGWLIFAAVFAACFIPLQWVASRRTLMIAIIFGVVLLGVGLGSVHMVRYARDDLGDLLIPLLASLTGVAMTIAGSVRRAVLIRQTEKYRRAGLTIVLGLIFGVLYVAGAAFAMSLL